MTQAGEVFYLLESIMVALEPEQADALPYLSNSGFM